MDDELYQGIIAALTAVPAITALIGVGADARIFRQIAPAGTAYPYCYLSLARPGKELRYYGMGGRDRWTYVAIGYVDRLDKPTGDRDVVLLDKYTDAALTNAVNAPGLTTFLRDSAVPDGPAQAVAQGTTEYVSAGSVYEAYFQL